MPKSHKPMQKRDLRTAHHAMWRAQVQLNLRVGLMFMSAGQIVMQALQASPQPGF